MSESAANADTRVTMERWLNTYIVADGQLMRHSATGNVLRRIDQCVAEEMPRSCAQILQQRMGSGDSAVWRIRELQMNFVVDVSSPGADEIAQTWGDRVAARIAEIVDRGTESDGVLRFANRAAYLAQFALDLSVGSAWGKWYYGEFRSLAALTRGRAIAEALAQEPEQGAQSILHLARSGRLDEILLVLTENDAQMICKQCFGFSDDSSSSAGFHSSTVLSSWSGRLLEVWNDEPMRLAGSAQATFHDALRWIARGALRFPGAEADQAACKAVQGLLELRRMLAAIPSQLAADRMVRDLAQKEISIEEAIDQALKQGAAFPESALRFIIQIAGGDSDWASQMTAVLLRDRMPSSFADSSNEAHSASVVESMVTLFGGIFLVGPALVNLNEIVEAAAGYGEHAGDIASYLRFIALTKCLGSQRLLESMGDPALRLLSGCHKSLLRDGIEACSSLDLARAQTFLARCLPRLTGCDGECLLAEVIRLPSLQREAILVRDLARDEWIYGTLLSPEIDDPEEILVSALDRLRESTGNVPHLLLHSSLSRLAKSPALQSRVHRLLVLDREEDSGELAEVLLLTRCITASTPREKIACLCGASDADLAYLSFGSLWPDFDVGLDLFGTLLARSALKGFARRLMGFQSSSPEHLSRNFLEGFGAVRSLQDRIEVELPRSSLLLVLQLSGLARQTYAVPWLEGREVCLMPPRE